MTVTLPETLQYGKVVGRFVLAVGDEPTDGDYLPNAVPAVGTISFTSASPLTKETLATPPTTVVRSVIRAAIDNNGFLYNPKDPTGPRGIWLVAGVYKVAYSLNTGAITGHDILVLPEHTAENPTDLINYMSPGGPILTASQYAELGARLDAYEAYGIPGPAGSTGPRGPVGPVQISPDLSDPELYDIGLYDWETSRWTVVPESFGAVGDGVADDTMAIQEAIDYAHTIRGTVRFTAAEYKVSPRQSTSIPFWPNPLVLPYKCLLLKDWVTLDLGTSRLVQDIHDEMLADSNYPDLAPSLIYLNRISNVKILGGVLVGDRVARNVADMNTDGSNSGLIEMYGCQNIYVSGVMMIEGTGDGLSIADKSRSISGGSTVAGSPIVSFSGEKAMLSALEQVPLKLSNTTHFSQGTLVSSVDVAAGQITMSTSALVTSSNFSTIFVRNERQNIIVENCTADGNRRNGITIESGRGIIIRNCALINQVGASPQSGIDVEPYYGAGFLEDVTIEGCITYGNGTSGIYIQTVKDSRLRNCDIRDGLGLRGGLDCWISDNRIRSLNIKTAAAVVTGNIFTNSGISIYNDAGNLHAEPLDVLVSGNVFELNELGSCITLYNPDNEPPKYRQLLLSGNRVTRDTTSSSHSLFGTANNTPVFKEVSLINNVVLAKFSVFMETNTKGVLFNDFPAAEKVFITNNTFQVFSANAYMNSTIAKFSGDFVLIENNTFNLTSPSTSRVFAIVADGQYRLLNNSVFADPLITKFVTKNIAEATVSAVRNVFSGITTFADSGVLATDVDNLSI